MTEREFATILARGHEIRGVEFKPPGPRTDRVLFARVARAVLGMANLHQGGMVIIGVNEVDNRPDATGLTSSDARTWTFDTVAAALSEYSDPNVSFELEMFNYQGAVFVILQVEEFDELPVLCRKDFPSPTRGEPPILRRGACYVRSRHKPETAEIRSQEEMRELLDLAVDKGIQAFIARAHRVGVAGPIVGVAQSSDEDLFNVQLGDLRE